MCISSNKNSADSCLDHSTPKCLPSLETSLSTSNVQNTAKIFHLDSNICMNISLILIDAGKWLFVFFFQEN